MAGASASPPLRAVERQARAGLRLFSFEDAGRAETDLAAAERFKEATDEQIASLEAEVAELTGKERKKERVAKSKQVSELKTCLQYIDACKVAKGLEPKNGYFIANAPKEAQKGMHLKEDEDSAGSTTSTSAPTSEELKELEQLREDLALRRARLRSAGASGASQSKDPQIVEWAGRLQALRDRQDLGSTPNHAGRRQGKSSCPLSPVERQELEKLRADIDAYRFRLRNELGFSRKDIRTDEEMQSMERRLGQFEQREL